MSQGDASVLSVFWRGQQASHGKYGSELNAASFASWAVSLSLGGGKMWLLQGFKNVQDHLRTYVKICQVVFPELLFFWTSSFTGFHKSTEFFS